MILIMARFSALLLVLCLLAFSSAKLMYAYSLVRHGAQYPKNDLYDGNQTKQFWGQLTPIGERQHYNLGTYYRQEYMEENNIVSLPYDPHQVQFYATSYSRAQISTYSFIYGLYPLGHGWTVPEGLNPSLLEPPYTTLFSPSDSSNDDPFALEKGFTSTPVHPIDDVFVNCPNYDTLLTARLQQVASKLNELVKEEKSLISRIAQIFKLTPDQENLQTLIKLYETVQADRYLGRELPAAFTAQDLKGLKYLYQSYYAIVLNDHFGRVLATPSLRMIRAKLSKAAIGKSNLTFTHITAHQDNLQQVFNVLQWTSPECLNQQYHNKTISQISCLPSPAYAANLVFELHKEGSLLVRVAHNGEYIYPCGRRQLQCPLDEFLEKLKGLETTFEQECLGRFKPSSPEVSQQ